MSFRVNSPSRITSEFLLTAESWLTHRIRSC